MSRFIVEELGNPPHTWFVRDSHIPEESMCSKYVRYRDRGQPNEFDWPSRQYAQGCCDRLNNLTAQLEPELAGDPLA
jgi:hypothetical protein